MRVLSARSATTGGGMALVANCAAERSRAIVCRGGVLWGSWATGQRGAKARGNEVPMHGATRCQKTGQRGAEERGSDVPPDCRAPEWRPECRTPERWSAAGVLSTTGDLGTAGVRAMLGLRTEGALSRLGGTLGRWSTGWPTDWSQKLRTRWGA